MMPAKSQNSTEASNTLMQSWKHNAKRMQTESYVVYLACRDIRTPWYAKLWAGLVVAYAFSPLDLIPDFIPVLGYLDDLVLVPLGIALAIKLIPSEVLADSRAAAQAAIREGRPINWLAALVVIGLWVALACLAIRWLVPLL